VENKEFFPLAIFLIIVLSLLRPSVKRPEEDEKLASRDLDGFVASKCFVTPETKNMPTVSSRKGFIMQEWTFKCRATTGILKATTIKKSDTYWQ
jgi:hypothetical protein